MKRGFTPVDADNAAQAGDGSAKLLDIRSLRVQNRSRQTLVRDVSFGLDEGASLAIVGESGSGKSLTARSIVGLLPSGLSAEGTVSYRGHDLLTDPARAARLRGSEICLLLQDPFTMLHPMLRCGDIITENLRDGSQRRLSGTERKAQALRRLAEVGLRDPGLAARYPFELSGGQRQRVAIAAALAQDPRLLIADEPSTALDATTKKEVLDLLLDLQRSRSMSLILITHDLRVAFSVCERVNVLYAGELLESGSSAALAAVPHHPYTLALLLAEPPMDRRVADLVSVPGSVPRPDDVDGCCAFAPRCSWSADACLDGKPVLAFHPAPVSRSVACVRTNEIASDMARRRASLEQATLATEPAAEAEPLLEVRHLTVAYGRSRRALGVAAVRDVSLRLASGESVGVVGESGSGKTTLSRTIVGLVEPTSGSIIIDGSNASSYRGVSVKQRRDLRRRVQIVFQDPYSSLNPAHTIGDALAEALHFGEQESGVTDIEGLLDRVGLRGDYRKRTPQALSGGERQRVAIARALAVRPRLLICDEPVSALDVSVQSQILALLRDIREELKLAFLFITHDLAVVRQVADRLYVMNRGEIVEEGTTSAVLDSPRHAYTQQLVQSSMAAHAPVA